jgi:hypothetical protein
MNTLTIWKLRAILFAVILAVAALSPALHGENLDDAVEINVPFAFENGSQHFKPGHYTIRMAFQNVMIIQGNSRSGFVMEWLDEDNQPSKTSKAVFLKYGDQYFLHEIWIEGETTHTYCLPSKAEQREIAANKAAATGVVVAALETPR